jgi:DNA-binding SARP family transcriptional activator
MQASLLEKLCEHAFRSRAFEECIAWCHALLRLDSCHEGAYRWLMHSHFELGRLARSARWYGVCKRVLHEELDLEPSPETQHLYRELMGRAAVA